VNQQLLLTAVWQAILSEYGEEHLYAKTKHGSGKKGYEKTLEYQAQIICRELLKLLDKGSPLLQNLS
jgi:hypothetical protein